MNTLARGRSGEGLTINCQIEYVSSDSDVGMLCGKSSRMLRKIDLSLLPSSDGHDGDSCAVDLSRAHTSLLDERRKLGT